MYFEPIWNNGFTTTICFLDSAIAKRAYAMGLSELTDEQSSLPPELTLNKTKFRAELTNPAFLLYRFIVRQIYYSIVIAISYYICNLSISRRLHASISWLTKYISYIKLQAFFF
jgi:hypothetical protein